MSGEWLFDPVARLASVFARPRSSCAVDVEGLDGESEALLGNASGDGERVALDSYERDREPIATVRPSTLVFEGEGFERHL